MKMEKADGPKTELVGVSSRMQQSIEEMIASVSRGVGDCMENARHIEPKNSADDLRSCERRDAMQMVSATAELLSSVAKVKGEFQHNYTIMRTSEKERAFERAKERAREETGLTKGSNYIEIAELLNPEEVEALNDCEREEYFQYLRLPPVEIRRSAESIESAATPLPENAGSNGHAGKS